MQRFNYNLNYICLLKSFMTRQQMRAKIFVLTLDNALRERKDFAPFIALCTTVFFR